MGRISTESARRKARKKAKEEYERGWNLRPAQGVAGSVVKALQAEAAALRVVRALTLADAQDDSGGAIRVVVGVRIDPKGPMTFAQVVARLRKAVGNTAKAPGALEFDLLDDDVDTTMADGSANPYVIYTRR